MRLKYQLFLTLLLSSALLIASMAAISSWTLDRGFSSYVIENEKRRLQPLLAALRTTYSEHKSWEWISEQPELLHELIRTYQGTPDAPRSGPGNRPGDPAARRPERIVLIDAQRQLLVGREVPENNVVWLPIDENESTVAYLGVREPRGLPNEIEGVFLAQQLRNYSYAAIVMVLCSALFAILIASRIVKPILSINKVVGQLTGGKYENRIVEHRRDEIGDLSRNINRMALTLEKNQVARRQWMAEISHELRTPTAVMRAELEAIQDGINEADEDAIASLHAESIRLGRLIDDLHELSLSDMGALNYQMETVDLHALIAARLERGMSLVSQAKLTLTSDLGNEAVAFTGDAQRLAQLLDNLLQNSVRYTESGGRISVSLQSDRDQLILQWEDTTPGVSDEQLPKLFEPLYRAEMSRNREHGGSGLGLTIVSKIAEAHQGTVTAYHSSLGGLGIRIKFPR